ncbi:MAG TPA: hypothetical protein EYG57_06335 [Planctomycetes bacterium]|nr:hypothetical protein [Planctomycetota bacterium]
MSFVFHPPLRLFVLVATLSVAAHVAAGTSNSLMDISADGLLLACSNRDSGTVSIVDLKTRETLREISVGKKPEGVSFLGSSHRLAVAVYGMDKVVFLDADADTSQKLAATKVFDEPYGVVSNASGSTVYVTLDFPGQVIEIDTSSLEIKREFSVGNFIRGIAITGGDDRLLVTEFYTSNVKAIDLKSGDVVDQWQGASTDNLARQIVLNPKRPKAYLPHIRSRITAIHGSGSIFPYLTIVDTIAGEGKRRTRIPVDSAFSTPITSNPWEVTISADGRQLYVVFSSTNDMFVCNVVDDDYREVSLRRQVRLGANPRAVRVSPDLSTVYVYEALDFNVAAYDTKSLRRIADIEVTDNPLDNEILVGKKLFYSALAPMASRRWIACSSCHPDGEPDGRTWHNPEGLRNTQSMAGMAFTHPIHWSADRDEVQDFEHTIRGLLMQGRGLIRGKVQPALGPPNKGLSAQLDALAAYSNSHKVALSPFSRDGLSEKAKHGRDLFLSAKTKCATCHTGGFFSDSTPRAADQIVRHNVGTGDDDPTEKMGPAYDTPTLLGIYRTAPYLHHGKAETLEEVLTKYNPDDHHGVTSHLTKSERLSLVEFLKALPFEDPLLTGPNIRVGD